MARTKGSTSGPQQGSLGAKLYNIRVGEMIAIEDDWQEGTSKPTQMERQVGAILNQQKHGYLKDRKFNTIRVQVIVRREVVPMLLVSRVE